MSDLSYYAVSPGQSSLPHRGGLIAWGVIAIVIGSLFILGCAIGAVIMLTIGFRFVPAGQPTPRLLPLLIGLSFGVGMGVAQVAVGVGCCRGRRWTAPLLVAAGWVALVGGVLSIVPTFAILIAAASANATAGSSSPGLPPQATLIVTLVTAAFGLLIWIGVPVTVIAWFGRPGVGRTLAELDPHARWTDGVPRTLLAWIVVCVWYGLAIAIAGLAGVHLWFTTILHGPAAVAVSLIGVAIVAAGYGCYRRSTFAWAASVGLFALMGASAATFAVVGDTAAYQRELLGRATARAATFRSRTRPASAAGPTTGAVVTTTTTTVAVGPTPTATAFGRVNPGLGPALAYTAAAGFGLCVLPRLRRVTPDQSYAESGDDQAGPVPPLR